MLNIYKDPHQTAPDKKKKKKKKKKKRPGTADLFKTNDVVS